MPFSVGHRDIGTKRYVEFIDRHRCGVECVRFIHIVERDIKRGLDARGHRSAIAVGNRYTIAELVRPRIEISGCDQQAQFACVSVERILSIGRHRQITTVHLGYRRPHEAIVELTRRAVRIGCGEGRNQRSLTEIFIVIGGKSCCRYLRREIDTRCRNIEPDRNRYLMPVTVPRDDRETVGTVRAPVRRITHLTGRCINQLKRTISRHRLWIEGISQRSAVMIDYTGASVDDCSRKGRDLLNRGLGKLCGINLIAFAIGNEEARCDRSRSCALLPDKKMVERANPVSGGRVINTAQRGRVGDPRSCGRYIPNHTIPAVGLEPTSLISSGNTQELRVISRSATSRICDQHIVASIQAKHQIMFADVGQSEIIGERIGLRTIRSDDVSKRSAAVNVCIALSGFNDCDTAIVRP